MGFLLRFLSNKIGEDHFLIASNCLPSTNVRNTHLPFAAGDFLCQLEEEFHEKQEQWLELKETLIERHKALIELDRVPPASAGRVCGSRLLRKVAIRSVSDT